MNKAFFSNDNIGGKKDAMETALHGFISLAFGMIDSELQSVIVPFYKPPHVSAMAFPRDTTMY